MDRREFLKSTGAVAVTSAVGTAVTAAESAPSAPAISKRLTELRLALPWAESPAGPADWARRLSQHVASLSDGRLRLALVFDVAGGLTAVRAGNADLYFGDVTDDTDAHRAFAYFSALPGEHGMAPQHLQAWLNVGGGQELWDDLAADLGIKPLLAAHTGTRSFFLAAERVETMGALAGRRVRAHGLARDVARGLGLEPVELPPGQVAASMRSGDVLAAECGGAIVSYACGLPAAAPYAAGASIDGNGRALALCVRRNLWDTMSASQQAILSAAAAMEFHTSLTEEEAHRPFLYPSAPQDRIWPIAAELAHAIQRVADAVVAHTAGYDAAATRIAASYAAFRRAAAYGNQNAIS
ncbi:MAG TPA: hypothetical protein VNR51_11590 [Hyphomicrobium sp.]|nr:hypothetical protein [Hyphomicrobium sp.]